MRGQFRFWPGTPQELVVPNQVVAEGEEAFLKMITQDYQTDIAAGANFYVGLCGNFNDNALTLGTLGGEPTVTNGYARKAVARNGAGWPTQDSVGGIRRAATGTLTFTASGGPFSIAIRRAFLCNVAAGAGGKLFAISGALPAAIQVVVGVPLLMSYELFLR